MDSITWTEIVVIGILLLALALGLLVRWLVFAFI